MLFDRVGAAAFILSSALGASATAASRLDGFDRPELRLMLWEKDAGRGGNLERPLIDRGFAGLMDDPMSDRTQASAFPTSRMEAPSAVPLPTGLSLFGSGILTLGLVGLLSGAQRRRAFETIGHADAENSVEPGGAAASSRFRIEVRSDRGHQVRHTGSARVAIDVIADLLNDGWDMISISDRSGVRIDYEDVVDACNRERERCRSR